MYTKWPDIYGAATQNGRGVPYRAERNNGSGLRQPGSELRQPGSAAARLLVVICNRLTRRKAGAAFPIG